MSRFHLAALAPHYAPLPRARVADLTAECDRAIESAVQYAREHLEDPREISDWTWRA